MIYRERDLRDTLCHFNQNHDPKTGRFSGKNGGLSSGRNIAPRKQENSKQKYDRMVQNLNTAYENYMNLVEIFNSGFHFNNADDSHNTQLKIKEMNSLLDKARAAKKEYDTLFDEMNEDGANLSRFEDIDKLENICNRIAKTINKLNDDQPAKHSDYLVHFNQNHDPETGKFTDNKGSFVSDKTKAKIKSIAKTAGRYALRGAVIAASVASGRLMASALSGAASALGAQVMGNILASGVGQIGMGVINSYIGADNMAAINQIASNPEVQSAIASVVSNPQGAMNAMQQVVNDPAAASALQETMMDILVSSAGGK